VLFAGVDTVWFHMISLSKDDTVISRDIWLNVDVSCDLDLSCDFTLHMTFYAYYAKEVTVVGVVWITYCISLSLSPDVQHYFYYYYCWSVLAPLTVRNRTRKSHNYKYACCGRCNNFLSSVKWHTWMVMNWFFLFSFFKTLWMHSSIFLWRIQILICSMRSSLTHW